MSTIPVQPYAINFISSDTTVNNYTFIRDLYRNILDRSVDKAGLDFWASQLNDHHLSRTQVISSFFNSPELQSQFTSAHDVVLGVSHALLLKEPDILKSGEWEKALSSGTVNAGDIAALHIASPEFAKLQNTSATLPVIDVIWEDEGSWDSVTAAQLAKLIAYDPNSDGSYPNQDLHFIVSGVGPLSKAMLSAKSHRYLNDDGYNASVAKTVYANTADGLAQFISAISEQVNKLTNGKIHWATEGGTGSVGYHPDTTTYGYDTDANNKIIPKNHDFDTDWAGATIGGLTLPTAIANAYQGYVDYTLYLNKALSGYVTPSGQSLKHLTQLVYETEGTYPDAPPPPESNDPAPPPGWEAVLLKTVAGYSGNGSLLPSGWKTWHDPTGNNGIALAATGESITPWTSLGADQWLAQIYDLLLNTTDYTTSPWTIQSIPDPGSSNNTASAVAQAFATFFAKTGTPESDANVIKMLADGALKYSPNTTFVFSYGPGLYNANAASDITQNQPIFQFGEYKIDNSTHAFIRDPADAGKTNDYPYYYTWSGRDFGDFSTQFKADLTTNLQQVASKTFPNATTPQDITAPVIGVWGGERALDAWFGYVDLT